MWRSTPYLDAEAMPGPPDPHVLTGNYAPVPDETTLADLPVEGTLPVALSGQYLRIGPNPVAATTSPGPWRSLEGMVHGVTLRAGRAVGYRNRWVLTDAVARVLGTDTVPGPGPGPADAVATNVISFGGRILALGPAALAYELDHDLVTVGRVDLAGGGRGIGAHPQVDPLTGALHFISFGDEPARHTVSPGGQTRITVPIADAPRGVHGLLLTRDRIVLLGGHCIGVVGRAGGDRPQWSELDPDGAFDALDRGKEVAVMATGASLRRITVDAGAHARHEVLDHTPQELARINPGFAGLRGQYVWTVAAGDGREVFRHDLRTGDRTSHDLGVGRHPGELSFVADPSRRHREDGGWLIGFVHDESRNEADLIVLDAAAIDRPPVAVIHIPRRIPYGLHGTWIPAT